MSTNGVDWPIPQGSWVEARSRSQASFVHWRGHVVGWSGGKGTCLILTPSRRVIEWPVRDTVLMSQATSACPHTA
jgi:hypothetical protein